MINKLKKLGALSISYSNNNGVLCVGIHIRSHFLTPKG